MTGAICPATFRTHLGRGDVLAGTFIKTSSGNGIEVMGDAGLDFVIIDKEYAALGREAIDHADVAAGRSGSARLVEHIARRMWPRRSSRSLRTQTHWTKLESSAGVTGVDALFVGRGDLAVAIGERSMAAPRAGAAAERAYAASRAAGKPVMVFIGTRTDAQAMRVIGVSDFICSSDQGQARQAARMKADTAAFA
jgi:2-keto-3-deoxy-L-rhamnonate aldolase RhmA